MKEQKIVEITREILVNDKGYLDPANCEKSDLNNLIVYLKLKFIK